MATTYKTQGTDLLYKGNIVQVFPFWPNYRQDFLEYWEWKTSILKSFNGVEQRITLRKHPRRSFEFEVFANLLDRAALENYLYKGKLQDFAVPDWNIGVRLTEANLPNPDTLWVKIDTANFRVGQYLVCFVSPTHHEISQIAEVSSTGIRINTPAQWVSGSVLMPLLFGRLSQTPKITRITKNFTSAVVAFEFYPETSNYEKTPPANATLATYAGYPVVEDTLDWSNNIEVGFDYNIQLLDNSMATPLYNVMNNTPEMTQTCRWFLHSQNNTRRFIYLLHLLAGRRSPFWLPSASTDMIPINLSGPNLTINEVGYTRLVWGSNSRKAIRIETFDNTAYYFQILSAISVGMSAEQLTLDYAPTFLSTDIKTISFLELVRLDQDRVELAYKGKEFATSTNTVRTLSYVL